MLSIWQALIRHGGEVASAARIREETDMPDYTVLIIGAADRNEVRPDVDPASRPR